VLKNLILLFNVSKMGFLSSKIAFLTKKCFRQEANFLTIADSPKCMVTFAPYRPGHDVTGAGNGR